MEKLIFYVLGAVGIVAGLTALTRRNPLHGAAWLVVFFVSISLLFFALAAPFVGAMELLIYAGAILVLYVFIVMLLDLSEEESGAAEERPFQLIPALVSVGLFGCLFVAIMVASWNGFFDPEFATAPAGLGSAEGVGMSLFTRHTLPFELVSILLLVAAIGSVVLAKRRISDRAEDTQGVGAGLAGPPRTTTGGQP